MKVFLLCSNSGHYVEVVYVFALIKAQKRMGVVSDSLENLSEDNCEQTETCLQGMIMNTHKLCVCVCVCLCLGLCEEDFSNMLQLLL